MKITKYCPWPETERERERKKEWKREKDRERERQWEREKETKRERKSGRERREREREKRERELLSCLKMINPRDPHCKWYFCMAGINQVGIYSMYILECRMPSQLLKTRKPLPYIFCECSDSDVILVADFSKSANVLLIFCNVPGAWLPGGKSIMGPFYWGV